MLLRTAFMMSLLSSWPAIAFAATQPEDARGFLQRWLDAQNTGAFDAYQKLYADDFKGVRRSGPRSATFDRNSWLEDRRRMFQKKMTALWQVDGPPASPRLTLRNQPDESMTMRPTAAVDLDGDGHVELLFDGFSDYRSANIFGQPQFLEHGVVRALGDSYIDIEGPETPILICPC